VATARPDVFAALLDGWRGNADVRIAAAKALGVWARRRRGRGAAAWWTGWTMAPRMCEVRRPRRWGVWRDGARPEVLAALVDRLDDGESYVRVRRRGVGCLGAGGAAQRADRW